MTKIVEIDHEIDKSRIWREHQKQIFEERMKNNSQMQRIIKQQANSQKDERNQEKITQNKKLIQKMKISQNKLIKRPNNNSFVAAAQNYENSETIESQEGGEQLLSICQDWQQDNFSPCLMESVAATESKVNEQRQKSFNKAANDSTASLYGDEYLAFLNSIDDLASGNLFNKKKQQSQQSKESSNQDLENSKQPQQQKHNGALDKDKLKQQLDDIDKQLRQMQDLLKD